MGGGTIQPYNTPVSEGAVYEVTIEDIGREGDGIALIRGFVVFVPGTKIGDSVKIKVDKVMRQFAIASVRQPDSDELREKNDVSRLITALGDANSSVREGAVDALGEIGNERAVKPLITALGDEHEYVRKRAAEALGKIGNERAVKPLITVLEDEEKWVRGDAAEAAIPVVHINACKRGTVSLPFRKHFFTIQISHERWHNLK